MSIYVFSYSSWKPEIVLLWILIHWFFSLILFVQPEKSFCSHWRFEKLHSRHSLPKGPFRSKFPLTVIDAHCCCHLSIRDSIQNECVQNFWQVRPLIDLRWSPLKRSVVESITLVKWEHNQSPITITTHNQRSVEGAFCNFRTQTYGSESHWLAFELIAVRYCSVFLFEFVLLLHPHPFWIGRVSIP